MHKIIQIIISDILKNKIVLSYCIILAALSWSSFFFEDNPSKGLLTILNIILFTVPLVSILFTTIYVYNSSEFIELLLSQPIKRKRIWSSLYLSVSSSLVLAYLIGAGIPLLIYSPDSTGFMMIISGVFITLIFTSLAFLTTVLTSDKAKGVGIAIMTWLFFALLYGGLILFLLFQFANYPIEKPMIILTALNPIDLSRTQLLMHMEVSAMMGYTGAVFKSFFGAKWGIIVSFVLLSLWTLVPFFISLKKFLKKDL